MILQEINHTMPIYRDCTLAEILFVGGSVLMSEMIIFSLLTKLLFGYACIGVAITFVTFFHITKFSLGKLQHVKYGRPYGYYKHLTIKKMMNYGLMKNRYVTRVGKWSIRRSK